MSIPQGSMRVLVAVAAAGALTVPMIVNAPTSAATQTSAASRCAAMTVDVHVSINPATKASLLTPWANEAAKAKSSYGFTSSSGVPFKASIKPAAGLTAVHRLYNGRTNDFLWTDSTSEVKSAVASGYGDQGTSFYALSTPANCATTVYRFVKGGIHRYVTTSAQRQSLTASGWRSEGAVFYGASPAAANPASVSSSQSTPSKATTAKVASAAAVTSSTARTVRPSTGPYANAAYVSTTTKPYKAWAAATNPSVKQDLYQIASTSTALWLGGGSGDAAAVGKVLDAAAKVKRTPQFVLYAIPFRDCGSYSAGGLNTVAQYESWVNQIKRAVAGRKAIFIVEPDAIAMSCLSAKQQADRFTMLKYAMSQLQSANSWTYIHAGSSGLDPQFAATQLRKAGVFSGRGFAVNVSSFDTPAKELAYGKSIDKALGANVHFVIDTSRGGAGKYTGSNGGAPKWCNPPGRALGPRPTIYTPDSIVDAYLWIKIPGESDGNCHAGDPQSGSWFQSYALGLVNNALDRRTITRSTY